SFLAMNFTGASTYTSLSGVRREVPFALPIRMAFGTAGFVLWVVGRFV
ncbi:MAG: acetyl-CoA synthase subunit gamma, partial [Planctomycetia bacterium]|nr:acetyl-CoA synthase subunit gamma [Planctomycetia bacterium]